MVFFIGGGIGWRQDLLGRDMGICVHSDLFFLVGEAKKVHETKKVINY